MLHETCFMRRAIIAIARAGASAPPNSRLVRFPDSARSLSRCLFGQDQLAVARFSQHIGTAVVLNEQHVASGKECIAADMKCLSRSFGIAGLWVLDDPWYCNGICHEIPVFVSLIASV